VRDVMFFLEARTKIEAGEGEMAEVAGGDVTVPVPPAPSAQTQTQTPRRKKKGKR